jgi:DNA-binding NarL/FixJ family response regulator
MTTVVIVDDDELVRVGLRTILEADRDIQVVGEAADATEGLSLIARSRPDVVLMDVRMPGIDGLQATRLLLARSAQPPRVLVVTTFENDDYVFDALRVGASGFILKRASPEEIVAAVRLVARGDSLLFPATIRRLTHARGARQQLPGVPLTDRELDVLRRLAVGRSNAEIAEELDIAVETVKTHVGNIFSKLQVRGRTQAAIAAHEAGLGPPESPPKEADAWLRKGR